jgi:hypothetical protein
VRKFSRDEKDINEELKAEGYKLYMTRTQVAEAAGYSRPEQGDEIMDGCPRYLLGKKHKYRRSDVARQIALSKM